MTGLPSQGPDAGTPAPAPDPPGLPPQLSELVPQARDLIRAVTMGAVATPQDRLRRAQDVSRLAVQVLRGQRYSVVIPTKRGPPKRHVTLDGWTTLGTLCGFVFGDPVLPHVVRCTRTEQGWECAAEARTGSGLVLSGAEAQCDRTESRWEGADDFSIRSMAQTRACSKALRLSLGWVLGLAGADYSLTPAEEMPTIEDAIPPSETEG